MESVPQSTESGALIGSNDDLLSEILLRLPVTAILRFKSVSKHWRWLLTDRHFTQRYDNLSKSPGLFGRHAIYISDIYVPYDVESQSPPPFRSLHPYFDRPGVKIVQSCNGLLLCCTDRGPKGYKGADRYYVFNPTTKQLALIPPVPTHMKVHKSMCFMTLAYHPTDCFHFKVVCIRSLEPNGFGELFQVQIYSSETRKWKISIRSFCAPKHDFRLGVYWNGAVYWAPYYRKYLYFKLDVEQLQTLHLPEAMSSEIFPTYFGESRGHLHLIAYKSRPENKLPLKVYEMLSDHSGWFVKYQVELDELLGAFPEMISPYGYNFSVIDVVREEDTFIVLKTHEKIITYNVHDKSFKHIFSLPNNFFESFQSFHRYSETLTSF